VLLVVVLLGAAMTASSAALLDRARSAAAELRTRRDVLCARYAATGGLLLPAPTPADGSAASVVDAGVESLLVWPVARSPSWCVLRSSAACGTALRTVERTAADLSLCDVSAP
jgi:hypothetical protein